MFSVGRLKARLQAFLAEATRSPSIGLTGPSQLTIERLVKIGLVLAITVILAGLAFWTWTDFAETRDAAVDKVSAAALVIEEHTHRSLLAIDVVLGSVAELVTARGYDALRSEAGWKELRRIASPLPKTGEVFVVDRTANIVLATPSHPPPVADISDREWVKLTLGGKEDFYIGRALKGRSVHGLFFPIARSIRSQDGTLIGAAQVGVEASYIAQLFSKLDVGSDAHLGLYRTRDGAVVARHPMTEALLEESVIAQPFFSTLANSEAPSWTGWIGRNGAERIVSARRLNGLPLIVSASLPKDQIYADAWKRLLWHAVAAAIAATALCVLTSLIVRLAKRESVLIGELDHRVKNMLTVVTTVIERSRESCGSVEELVKSLQDRIGSMAGTHALLSQSRWQGVNLADLVRAELTPYATAGNTALEGPTTLLTADATQPVAMVLHELATNAAKYGALSTRQGRVHVRWTVEPGVDQKAMLVIHWQETGGPKIVAPPSRGYGSDSIRELITYELGGTVELTFVAHGVWCTIELPAHWTIDSGS